MGRPQMEDSLFELGGPFGLDESQVPRAEETRETENGVGSAMPEDGAGAAMPEADAIEDLVETQPAMLVEENEALVPCGEMDDAEATPVERLKRRRLMPGASTSHDEFRAHFLKCQEQSAALLASEGRQPDRSDTIVGMCDRLHALVAEEKGDWPIQLRRLAVAALATYKLRLTDMYLREHAFLLWVSEGGLPPQSACGFLLLLPCGRRFPSSHRGGPRGDLRACRPISPAAEGHLSIASKGSALS